MAPKNAILSSANQPEVNEWGSLFLGNKMTMDYEEFAMFYGVSIRTVKAMVAAGDLLLVPRKKEGGSARINMVAFFARLLAQGKKCKYVPN